MWRTILFMSCIICGLQDVQAQAIAHVKTCSYEGYVFPENYVLIGRRTDGYTLSTQQIKKNEKLIKSNINDLKVLCPFINKRTIKKYIRQYLGRVDNQGDIIVETYLLKKTFAKDFDLNKDIVQVYDGGCDALIIVINITKGSVIQISTNGMS